MVAAQKLRDFAICYGASDKITVIVLTFGEKTKLNALYNNLGRESDFSRGEEIDKLEVIQPFVDWKVKLNHQSVNWHWCLLISRIQPYFGTRIQHQ